MGRNNFPYFYETFSRLVKKFFPLDKNYLLEQAQLRTRPHLLRALLQRVKKQYGLKINPLGLEDSFAIKIRNYCLEGMPVLDTPILRKSGRDWLLSNHTEMGVTMLDGFYEKLAAIYRFKFGDNQLGFLWDGSDHLEHYQKQWTATFTQWTENFCQHDLFVQAVLDLTVFLPENKAAQMIENRMNHFILKHFDLKILNKATGLRLQAAHG